LALKEMTEPTAREEEELRESKHDKEQLCNISRALAVLASASV
jgi:LETM1 and EF-hand domain-containing protein 1